VKDAPDTQVHLEFDSRRVVCALGEIDSIRSGDDRALADARQESDEPVGVAGIAQEELHGSRVPIVIAEVRSRHHPKGDLAESGVTKRAMV
jgi:hypothetical protein